MADGKVVRPRNRRALVCSTCECQGFDPEENEQTSELANVRNDIGSMWRVDWYEIAQSWIDDNPEEGATCQHCGRAIVNRGGRWIDPNATGDDGVWRETCDAHDTFTAEHEPEEA